MAIPKTRSRESLGLVKLVVIDYQSGNLRSVAKALESTGVRPLITGDPADLEDADGLVLPGVGSGPAAMAALKQRGLVEPLREYVASGRPFLGVCLGLQLLMERTDEGDAPCLDIIPGDVKRLPPTLKVPHMGWNTVHLEVGGPLFQDIPQDSHFYFVHSYYVEPKEEQLTIGVTEYSLQFCSVLARDNILATQFHPEKSGYWGLKVYRNFVEHAALVAAGS